MDKVCSVKCNAHHCFAGGSAEKLTRAFEKLASEGYVVVFMDHYNDWLKGIPGPIDRRFYDVKVLMRPDFTFLSFISGLRVLVFISRPFFLRLLPLLTCPVDDVLFESSE